MASQNEKSQWWVGPATEQPRKLLPPSKSLLSFYNPPTICEAKREGNSGKIDTTITKGVGETYNSFKKC